MRHDVQRIAVAVILAAAIVAGLVTAFVIYPNNERTAQGDAKSLCTNLSLVQFDKDNGASYATDTLVAGYEADLLDLGYTCNGGKLTKVQVINITNDQLPSATTPTCSADGKLVLPKVEHAAWERLVGNSWGSAQDGAGVGAYHVRLTPDKGYALNVKVENDITVQPRLTGDACKASTDQYQCRTSGPDGGPEFLALDPKKYGSYNYGPAFTATTIADAHQSIHDQGFCDPVWMLQKYREFVDPTMSSEQANAKVHELIVQTKAGDNAQWDTMLTAILSQFDKAQNSFASIDPGRYHSLGVITTTDDGVPRVVDFIVNDPTRAPVLRSIVTYADGSTATLELRTLCDLQLRTKVTAESKAKVTSGPAEAPQMSALPRNPEGNIVTTTPSPSSPAPSETPTTVPSSPAPSETPKPSPSPSTTTLAPKDPSKDINANPGIPKNEQVAPIQSAAPNQAQPTAPAAAPTTARINPPKPTATPTTVRTSTPPNEGGSATSTGDPVGP